MNKYALDSNIISYLLKGDMRVAKRIQSETFSGTIIIPPIAYYEVMRGLIAVKAVAKLRTFERLCASNIVGDITRDVLDAAVDIHVNLRRAGRALEDADILIAAFCVVNDCTLITHNIRHFEGIDGLQFEDWAAV